MPWKASQLARFLYVMQRLNSCSRLLYPYRQHFKWSWISVEIRNTSDIYVARGKLKWKSRTKTVFSVRLEHTKKTWRSFSGSKATRGFSTHFTQRFALEVTSQTLFNGKIEKRPWCPNGELISRTILRQSPRLLRPRNIAIRTSASEISSVWSEKPQVVYVLFRKSIGTPIEFEFEVLRSRCGKHKTLGTDNENMNL